MNTIELTRQYVMNTYARFPVSFVRGQGCYLWDEDGKKYLDLLAGIAVNGLGHCHPKVTEAICRQASTLIHTSNLFHVKPQAELAQMLCENSFAEKVFFGNSGAEANEAALKLARKYQQEKKGKRAYWVVTMEKSFHGRTYATMTATAQAKIKQGFEPLPEGFIHVPYDDVNALDAAVNVDTCAVLLEPVQGEGGVRFPSPGYLAKVREICDKNGALLIFDEVQSGMGRTGKLFAYQHSNIVPDLLTLAKSLGAGIPIGACLANDRVAQAFQPGTHASTFGGNFLACEAAKTFLRCLIEDGVLENAAQSGIYFLKRLQELKAKHALIKEVRGLGLMLGIDLTVPGKAIVENALQRGLIINCTQETTLRFLPPLIITTQEIDQAVSQLDEIFSEYETGKAK